MRELFIIVLVALSPLLQAQSFDNLYGNEWIRYNQPYYKMKVVEDGMYRIPRQALQQAGIDLNQIAPQNLQIFHQGREIPIYVEMNSGSIDYIEFYGKKNRGELDVNMYNSPAHHLNPEYSLINDTAAYFLSWSNENAGLHYTESTANLSNLPAKEDYYMHQFQIVCKQQWHKGKEYNLSGSFFSKSSFEYGEGWSSAFSNLHDIGLPISQLCPNAPTATCTLRVCSRSDYYHQMRVSVDGVPVHNENFFGDSVASYSFPIAASLLGTNSNLRLQGIYHNNDQHAISSVSINYPRLFDFEAKTIYSFRIEASTQRKFLEINNFSNPSQEQKIYLYDLNNGLRIHCFWDGSRVLVDLPAADNERELLLINEATTGSYKIMGRLDAVHFTDYRNSDADYIIIAHKALFNDGQGGNPVIAYAAYRASTGYHPIVIDIQQLYDQFGYGVNMHPLSLRNFSDYIKENWTNPRYIFLMGKGRCYTDVRDYNTYDHLIPSFGSPASDNLLFVKDSKAAPGIPFGRLAAVDAAELQAYLEKIVAAEASQNNPVDMNWSKNVLHLGGGADEMEQQMFSVALNNLKTRIEGVGFGAAVHSFFGKAEAPKEQTNSQRIDSLLREGSSLITYLGHGSGANIEFDIHQIFEPAARAKYPVFVSLACANGNIFSSNRQMSERLLFEENGGAAVAIGFTTTVAVSPVLHYSNELYDAINQNAGTEAFAQTHLQGLERLSEICEFNIWAELALHYLTYHGDPVFKLSQLQKPDYYIDSNSIHIEPLQVTNTMDNFELVFDLHNAGIAVDSNISLCIFKTCRNGQKELLKKCRITAPHLQTEIRISIPVGGQLCTGLNSLDILVDADSSINERIESNNSLVDFHINILQNQILPIFPQEFSIVGDTAVNLVAATGNMQASEETCYFQIDSNPNFDSPMMKETYIVYSGGIVEWQPDFDWQDSTLYFWRVATAPVENNAIPVWTTSSFMYWNGKNGWNQSNYAQFYKNELDGFTALAEQPNLDFVANCQEITLNNGFAAALPNEDYIATYYNGNLTNKCLCNNKNGVFVQVIDPNNLSIWMHSGQSLRYGSVNCATSGRDEASFLFETDKQNGRQALENFLNDTVPDGYYVLIYTLNNAHANQWPESLINSLQSQGASELQQLTNEVNGLPWAFYYRKSESGFPYRNESIGRDRQSLIHLSCRIPDKWYAGVMQSSLIGPASSWDSFSWDDNAGGIGQLSDKTGVNIYGIDTTGTKKLLIRNLQHNDSTLTNIDAKKYPYLQLSWFCKDSIDKTPALLRHWRVIGTFMPDLALRPELYEQGVRDSIIQGEDYAFSMAVQNIGTTISDSVWVAYRLVGDKKSIYKRISALETTESIHLPLFQLNTGHLEGPQQLLVEVNPAKTQKEAYYFNNRRIVDFVVLKKAVSVEAPELSVYFDEQLIKNGDLVNEHPKIRIRLNKLRAEAVSLADFKLVLAHPDFEGGAISLNENCPSVHNMELHYEMSGIAGENAAALTMELDLAWSGLYDFSVTFDNGSENAAELLNFRVYKPELSVSALSNYPNPFKEGTRFRFNLEGPVVPERAVIEIVSLSGLVVRRIGINELGPLQSGMNEPGFIWDAKDQNGAELPAGTYIYRFISDYNHPKATKMVGKMQLLR